MSLSPDGSMIASGSLDQSLILWTADNGKKLTSFFTHYSITNISMVISKQRIVLKLADRKPRISLLKMVNFD